MPDSCFTFAEADRVIWIEAKILEERRIVLSRNEGAAWCRPGTGKLPHHLWIATGKTLQPCWMWGHETFRYKLGLQRTSDGPVLSLQVEQFPDGCGIDYLVGRIVGWAETNGFYPKEAK